MDSCSPSHVIGNNNGTLTPPLSEQKAPLRYYSTLSAFTQRLESLEAVPLDSSLPPSHFLYALNHYFDLPVTSFPALFASLMEGLGTLTIHSVALCCAGLPTLSVMHIGAMIATKSISLSQGNSRRPSEAVFLEGICNDEKPQVTRDCLLQCLEDRSNKLYIKNIDVFDFCWLLHEEYNISYPVLQVLFLSSLAKRKAYHKLGFEDLYDNLQDQPHKEVSLLLCVLSAGYLTRSNLRFVQPIKRANLEESQDNLIAKQSRLDSSYYDEDNQLIPFSGHVSDFDNQLIQ